MMKATYVLLAICVAMALGQTAFDVGDVLYNQPIQSRQTVTYSFTADADEDYFVTVTMKASDPVKLTPPLVTAHGGEKDWVSSDLLVSKTNPWVVSKTVFIEKPDSASTVVLSIQNLLDETLEVNVNIEQILRLRDLADYTQLRNVTVKLFQQKVIYMPLDQDVTPYHIHFEQVLYPDMMPNSVIVPRIAAHFRNPKTTVEYYNPEGREGVIAPVDLDGTFDVNQVLFGSSRFHVHTAMVGTWQEMWIPITGVFPDLHSYPVVANYSNEIIVNIDILKNLSESNKPYLGRAYSYHVVSPSRVNNDLYLTLYTSPASSQFTVYTSVLGGSLPFAANYSAWPVNWSLYSYMRSSAFLSQYASVLSYVTETRHVYQQVDQTNQDPDGLNADQLVTLRVEDYYENYPNATEENTVIYVSVVVDLPINEMTFSQAWMAVRIPTGGMATPWAMEASVTVAILGGVVGLIVLNAAAVVLFKRGRTWWRCRSKKGYEPIDDAKSSSAQNDSSVIVVEKKE